MFWFSFMKVLGTGFIVLGTGVMVFIVTWEWSSRLNTNWGFHFWYRKRMGEGKQWWWWKLWLGLGRDGLTKSPFSGWNGAGWVTLEWPMVSPSSNWTEKHFYKVCVKFGGILSGQENLICSHPDGKNMQRCFPNFFWVGNFPWNFSGKGATLGRLSVVLELAGAPRVPAAEFGKADIWKENGFCETEFFSL